MLSKVLVLHETVTDVLTEQANKMLLRIPYLATEHKTLQKEESVGGGERLRLSLPFTNEGQTLSLHDTLSSKSRAHPPTNRNRLGEVV